ncbi:hypothetical protein D3C87_1270920 [compost metagenome]
MKLIISAFIFMGSVNASAFGTYSEEYNALAASKGFTNISNYCEAGAMNGQGASGILELTIREYKNEKGDSLTIVNYQPNDTAVEYYDTTDIFPLSITKAIQSRDVKGTRISGIREDLLPEEYELEALNPRSYESETKGALAQLLLGVDEKELATISEDKLDLKRININKFTKNYDLNDDVFIECYEKI